jgi:protein Tex
MSELILESAEQIALRINNQIATEMKVRPQQIGVAVGLMDEGSTVPFHCALSQRSDWWFG